MRIAIATLVCALVPPALHAQVSAPATRHDVTVSTGLIGTQYHQLEPYSRWHSGVFGGLNFGHYWSDHAKTDVEAGWLSRIKSESYELVPTDAGNAYSQGVYLVRDLRLSVAQLVQFGYQSWVHPFLGAGVDFVYRRTTEDRQAQQAIVQASGPTRTVSLPAFQSRERTRHAAPFVKGGFKIYFSDHGFVVQEFKLGLYSGIDHILWKTGVGVDF